LLSGNATARTTGRNPVEQAIRAQIFVNLGPMDAMAVANELPIRPLGWGRVRESPRPRERHADDAPIGEMSGDGLAVDDYVTDSILNADRSAHAKPQ